MATLAELVKGFRANVRDGNPCGLLFDGNTIRLYPLDEKSPKAKYTFVGISTKPSTRQPDAPSSISFGTIVGECAKCGRPTRWYDGNRGQPPRYYRYIRCNEGHEFPEDDGSGIYTATIEAYENRPNQARPKCMLTWSLQANCQYASGDSYPHSSCMAPADYPCSSRKY